MSEQEITIQDRLRHRIENRDGTPYEARSGAYGEDWGYDAELDQRTLDYIAALESELAASKRKCEGLREVVGKCMQISIEHNADRPCGGCMAVRVASEQALAAARDATEGGSNVTSKGKSFPSSVKASGSGSAYQIGDATEGGE